MISIILPTYNEAENIPVLLAHLREQVTGPFEVIIVDDDSPDETWKVAEALRLQYDNLQVLRRVGRRGLSSAVVEGFTLAKGDIFLVMDADLQHSAERVNHLVAALDSGADIAVASRYIEGGSVGAWVTGRRILSKTATFLARFLPPVSVSDPMSGFFAVRADVYKRIAKKLRPTGFKILLEILSLLPAHSLVAETPLTFQHRLKGKSKLSALVQTQFLLQLSWVIWRRILHCSQQTQAMVFSFLCVFTLALTLPTALRFRPLLESDLRSQVRTALVTAAESQGWLLSDLSVVRVEDEGIRILRREHRRGKDPLSCYDISFTDALPLPCAE